MMASALLDSTIARVKTVMLANFRGESVVFATLKSTTGIGAPSCTKTTSFALGNGAGIATALSRPNVSRMLLAKTPEAADASPKSPRKSATTVCAS
jgi:hypothetical protein